MSSMMAQRVATNNLAHSYMAFNTNYHDTGLFGVYAVSEPHSQPVDDLVSTLGVPHPLGFYLHICCHANTPPVDHS